MTTVNAAPPGADCDNGTEGLPTTAVKHASGVTLGACILCPTQAVYLEVDGAARRDTNNLSSWLSVMRTIARDRSGVPVSPGSVE